MNKNNTLLHVCYFLLRQKETITTQLKQKLGFVMLYAAATLGVSAQITVSGYVSDVATGEWLLGASVLELNSLHGTIVNPYGYYALQVQKGNNVSLKFSFTGYKPVEINCPVFNDTTINVQLEAGVVLNEFEVKGQGMQSNVMNQENGYSINIKSLKRLPAFGGEVDVLKAFQLLPGIQGGLEARGELNVRGGNPDQNLVLIDDVPVYYLHHLGGFVSMFNDDALNSASIITSAFPAQYGSRLSSILDVRVKDGNLKTFQGAGSIGMISAKLMLEGPIIKDKLSYMVSYRRFYYDAFVRPISYYANKKRASFGYNFYDFNGKLNWRISNTDKLYLSLYNGDDRFYSMSHNNEFKYDSNTKNRWGNSIASLRWNHQRAQRLFVNNTLSFTGYRFIYDSEIKEVDQEQTVLYLSGVKDFRLKSDYDFTVGKNYRLRFGAEAVYHHFKPAIMSVEVKSNNDEKKGYAPGTEVYHSGEANLYAENHIYLAPWCKTNVGLRLSSYYTENHLFINPEPRLDVTFKPTPHLTIKPSYTVMNQYTHLLAGTGVGLPSDIWLPATLQLRPSRSQQFSTSFTYELFKPEITMRLETYYKTMENLITLKEGIANLMGAGYWQNKIENNGSGRAKGIEFLIEKNGGRHTGWIAYTLSKTERSFCAFDNGDWYPYKYDRRHVLNLVYKVRLSAKVDFGATWTYHTGEALTLPVAHYLGIADDNIDYYADKTDGSDFPLVTSTYLYSKKNAFRTNAYHRLDLSLNFHKQKKWGERIWNISIYNAYAKMNPYYYYFKSNSNRASSTSTAEVPTLYQQTLFGFIPSVNYSFKF